MDSLVKTTVQHYGRLDMYVLLDTLSSNMVTC
jgi:hypothetical protein